LALACQLTAGEMDYREKAGHQAWNHGYRLSLTFAGDRLFGEAWKRFKVQPLSIWSSKKRYRF
jgi:hypothetical protein